jgi:hypothetical protein
MAYIVSADELKKTLPGYDPAHSSDFHRESARLADREYQRALRNFPGDRVILMAGGAASGKSEYVSVYLGTEDALVFDGTLPTVKGASIKISEAIKFHKEVEVHLVVPAYFEVAFVVFLNRERKFALKHFFYTHMSARKTVLEIAEQYPQVKIRIIESDVDFIGEGGTMNFREIEFSNRALLIDFLHQNQYSEAAIRNKLSYDV